MHKKGFLFRAENRNWIFTLFPTQISQWASLLWAGEGDPPSVGHNEGADHDPQRAAGADWQAEGGRGRRRDRERLEVCGDGAWPALSDHLHRVHDARHSRSPHHRSTCHRDLGNQAEKWRRRISTQFSTFQFNHGLCVLGRVQKWWLWISWLDRNRFGLCVHCVHRVHCIHCVHCVTQIFLKRFPLRSSRRCGLPIPASRKH